MGRLVVREDLVYAEDDVGEQQRALDWIAFAAAYAPSGQEHGTSDRNSNQCCIHITNLRKFGDSPEKVYGAGNDRSRHHKEAYLHNRSAFNVPMGEQGAYHPAVAFPSSVHKPSCDLSGRLDHQQAAKPLNQLEHRR